MKMEMGRDGMGRAGRAPARHPPTPRAGPRIPCSCAHAAGWHTMYGEHDPVYRTARRTMAGAAQWRRAAIGGPLCTPVSPSCAPLLKITPLALASSSAQLLAKPRAREVERRGGVVWPACERAGCAREPSHPPHLPVSARPRAISSDRIVGRKGVGAGGAPGPKQQLNLEPVTIPP